MHQQRGQGAAFPVKYPVPAGSLPAPGLADGTAAILCLRERAISIRPDGAGLPGRVLHVRFLGDVALVEVAVEGFDEPLKVRTPDASRLSRGANVRVEIDPARALVFAAAQNEATR